MATATNDPKLIEQIKTAQIVFVASASRLLDEAEDVRRQRDELMRLLGQLPAEQGATDAK